MDTPLPKRLGRSPFLEALWEYPFPADPQQPIGELLVGFLYHHLQKRKPEQPWKVSRLPTAQIPSILAFHTTSLRYAPKYRIESQKGSILYQVGDQVLTVHCRRPYVGWPVFEQEIIETIELLRQSGLFEEPQRHTLRFIYFFTSEEMPPWEGLRFRLEVGDQMIRTQPIQLRVELKVDSWQHILYLVHPVEVQMGEAQRKGWLIDLATVGNVQKDWEGLKEQVRLLHEASQKLFFQQILIPKQIKHLKLEF